MDKSAVGLFLKIWQEIIYTLIGYMARPIGSETIEMSIQFNRLLQFDLDAIGL